MDVKDGTVLALEELERITRRQMCTNAATGLIALALPSCTGFVIRSAEVQGHATDKGSPAIAPAPTGPGGSGVSQPVDPGAAGSGGAPGTGGIGEPGDPGGGETGGNGGSSGPLADAAPSAGGGRDAGRNGGRDAGRNTGPEAGAPPPDASPSAPSCSPGFNTNMAPSAFAMGTATYFSGRKTFVCRDSGGLYALTAVCTHAGCSVRFVNQNSGFRCPCHGSGFDFVGAVTNGPANSALRHFELCVGSDGKLYFDTNRTVNRSTRLTA